LSVPCLDLSRGVQAAIAPMTHHGPRSSYEREWLPYTKVAAERVVRMAVGQELRARYEARQDLSDEVLTLVMRLREREDGK
jgi:hypothetical protein